MMNRFLPDGYISHNDAWLSAYLHEYGDIEKDDDLQRIIPDWYDQLDIESAKLLSRQKAAMSVNVHSKKRNTKSLSSRTIYSRVDRTLTVSTDGRYLIAGKHRLGLPADRLERVRKSIFDQLYDGKLTAYLIGTDLYALQDRGVWLQQENFDAFNAGKIAVLVNGAVYRTEFYFKEQDIREVFPNKAETEMDRKFSTLPPIVQKGVPIYRRKWPSGHQAGGASTQKQAIHLLFAEEEFRIGSENFGKLAKFCADSRRGSG